MQSPPFLKSSDVPVDEIGKGLTRQVLGFNNQVMLVRVYFEEGAEGYLHSHFHAQVSYVESGEFEVTVGTEKKTLVAGDCFFVEPNADHGAVCKRKGVLIDVFSPAREDFLEETVK